MRTSNEGMNINRTLQFLSNTEISTIYLVSSRNFDSELGWPRVDHLGLGGKNICEITPWGYIGKLSDP